MFPCICIFCNVALQLLPSRGGVYFLTPWIWTVLMFFQFQVQVKRFCTLLSILLEFCHHHMKKPGLPCWRTRAHPEEQGSAVSDEANLDQPITSHHPDMWANPVSIKVATHPIAEHRCMCESCWNTNQPVDLWAKINAVTWSHWVLRCLFCYNAPDTKTIEK